MIECPTCGREDFEERKFMKIHHAKSHDEKIPFTYKCDSCGKDCEVDDYVERKYCPQCSEEKREKREITWGDKISQELQRLHSKEGGPFGEEWREKQIKTHSGENHFNWNKTLPEETRRKISEANIEAWEDSDSRQGDEEWVKKQSEAHKGQSPPSSNHIFIVELGHLVRSNWEIDIGFLLQSKGIQYEYEKEFKLEDGSSYYPDYVVGDVVVEVKGFINNSCEEKAEKFMESYSDYTYIVVGNEIPCDIYISWENRSQLVEVI